MLLSLALAGLLAAQAGAQTAPRGIDVSHWEGQIDWLQVGAAGYSFAFAKATEGTTVTDATYPLNRTGAGSVGMRVGAYHFARPTGGSDAAVVASAIAQANAFLAFAQPRPGDLLPALDLETTGGLSASRLTAWTQAWLDEVAAEFGVKAIIYASTDFWKTALGDTSVFAAAGHPLWIAHWTKAALPSLPGGGWGGRSWLFWQWTDCESVPGIAHCVDGDRFNGTSLATATIPALPSGRPVSTARPSIVGTPQAGWLLAAIPGRWGGGKPASFAYRWRRCDAAGAGCVPIAGAASETYTPTTADVGHALVVSATAQTAGGRAVAVSRPTLAVASPVAPSGSAPAPVSPPTIQGRAQAGQRLSARVGTWTGSPSSFAYQWRRCGPTGTACAAIPGTDSARYTITPGDIGATLSLVVTATSRGGSGSAATAPTPVVVPAPLPPPAVGSATVQPGRAGAVTTPDRRATVTWQPGAVPAHAQVGLAAVQSRLALRGTALSLRIDAPVPLAWPVEVRYAAGHPHALPGFLPGKGIWQPVAQLASPSLPSGQEVGAYRDASGAVHILTRRPGRMALFAPGRWGDPRFVSPQAPRLTLVNRLVVRRSADGTVLVDGRLTLDSQAHLYASVAKPRGLAVLLPHGSRLGQWLEGRPTTTLQTLVLRPGVLPIQVRIPARQLAAKGSYALRLAAVDPYRRRGQLVVPLTQPRGG